MQHTAEYWIEALKLQEHPEGGYYRITYESRDAISDRELSVSFEGRRFLATSIYFLLDNGQVSRFHRLIADELWYYHAGNPVNIFCIERDGKLVIKKLGLNLHEGERPQVLVPGGTIFGSAPDGCGYSLAGCMVTPGFDFEDFELLSREDLLRQYPQYKRIIYRLT